MDAEIVTTCLFVLAVVLYVAYFIFRYRGEARASVRSLQKFVVTEGMSSSWHYHLSDRTNSFMSLCGRNVFPTRIPLAYFRSIVGRRRERLEDGYACPECAKFLD